MFDDRERSRARCQAPWIAVFLGFVALLGAERRASALSADNDLGVTALEPRDCVRLTLARNPSLEAAQQATLAALARIRQAGSWPEPMVELGVAPLSVVSSRAPVGVELSLSQQFPWFGKRGTEQAAARADAEAMKSDYQVLRRELALTAFGLCIDYFLLTQSLSINAAHRDLLKLLNEHATAQLATGRGSPTDAFAAERELAQLEQEKLTVAAQREVTVAELNELFHRAPELPLPPPPAALQLAKAEELPLSRLQSEAAAQRSELTAGAQRIQAETSREARAAREGYPDIALSTSYNSMWGMPEHRWMMGAVFSVPLSFDKRAGMRDEARARRNEVESDLTRTRDAVRTQVFVSLKQLVAARSNLSLFEARLLPLAQRQLEAARAAFTSSQLPLSAVLEAERNSRRTELEYQTARAECLRREAALARALGRIPGLDREEKKP